MYNPKRESMIYKALQVRGLRDQDAPLHCNLCCKGMGWTLDIDPATATNKKQQHGIFIIIIIKKNKLLRVFGEKKIIL